MFNGGWRDLTHHNMVDIHGKVRVPSKRGWNWVYYSGTTMVMLSPSELIAEVNTIILEANHIINEAMEKRDNE